MGKSNPNRVGVAISEPVVEAEAKVTALSEMNREVMDWRKIHSLRSNPEYERCAAVLVALKGQINEAEEERKKIVDPLNGVVKHVNQKFKPYKEAREELEFHLKNLIRNYLEEKRQQEMERAEKEAKAMEKKGAKQVALDIRQRAADSMPVPTVGPVSFRKRWAFKVVDKAKVPKEFLAVDDSAVQAAIKAGERKIPGLEIFEDTVVAVSA